jgi:hypothetical protein
VNTQGFSSAGRGVSASGLLRAAEQPYHTIRFCNFSRQYMHCLNPSVFRAVLYAAASLIGIFFHCPRACSVLGWFQHDFEGNHDVVRSKGPLVAERTS